MRWVVERSFAWFGPCRRLAKDFENLNRTALAFLRLASIRLMLRRLCQIGWTFRTDSEKIRHSTDALRNALKTGEARFRRDYLRLFVDRVVVSDSEIRISTRSMIRPHGASVIPRPMTTIPSRFAVNGPVEMHQH